MVFFAMCSGANYVSLLLCHFKVTKLPTVMLKQSTASMESLQTVSALDRQSDDPALCDGYVTRQPGAWGPGSRGAVKP